MSTTLYRRHRFPPSIIRYTVWLYFRFTLSFRDIEDLLAERGIDVSYETIRRWCVKFGLAYARQLRSSRPKPFSTWHIDEVFVRIGGKQMYLWRAVDAEGEVLDVLLQSKRDKSAAHTFLRKAKRKQAFTPAVIVSEQVAANRRRDPRGHAIGNPYMRQTIEQQGRKLTSANPKKRAQTATVQVVEIGSNVPFRACNCLQSFQYSTASHFQEDNATVSAECSRRVGRSNLGCVNKLAALTSTCQQQLT